jgi:hypothetical protein
MRRSIAFILLATLSACGEPQRSETPANVTDATPTPSPAPSAAVDLRGYEGKYPDDLVNGSGFLASAAVRAGVGAAVADTAVRDRVLDRDTTATPIALRDGRLLSYGCEPHNCGPHNWSIVIAPDGGNTAVCYYDADRHIARWYPEAFAAKPEGGCPSGDE